MAAFKCLRRGVHLWEVSLRSRRLSNVGRAVLENAGGARSSRARTPLRPHSSVSGEVFTYGRLAYVAGA